MTKAIKTLATAIALTLLAQCAGLDRSVELAPDDKVVVELSQRGSSDGLRDPIRQRLVTESVADPRDFYRSRQTDPLTKVVPTERMQLLLDGLATARFFDYAAERALTIGSTELQVEINGKTLVWPRRPSVERKEDVAELTEFNRCIAAFLDIYNSTAAYRSSSGGDSVLERHLEQRASRGARQ